MIELDRVREKYPQYRDMDDITLASNLAKKYPQYQDILDRVKGPVNPKSVGMKEGLSAAGQALSTSLIPEKIWQSPAGEIASSTVGFAGGNPFLSAITPPQIRQQLGEREAKAITSPIGMAGIVTTALGMKSPKIQSEMKSINKGIEELATMEGKWPKVGKTNWFDEANQVKLAGNIRNAISQTHHGNTESYGIDYDKFIKNSNKTINSKNIADNFIKNVEDSYGNVYQDADFMEAIAKKDPYANRIRNIIDKLNNGEIEITDEISVREADNLSKWIRQLPSIRTKLKSGGNYTNSERLLLDLSNDLKASVIDASPEMKATKLKYGQTENDIRTMRKYLREGGAIKNLKNFFNLDPEIRGAFERSLPSSSLNKLKEFAFTIRQGETRQALLKQMGMTAAKTAVGSGVAGAGVGAYQLLKNMFGR